jgi:hypothetical protein
VNTLPDQFRDALSRLEIDSTRAIAAHVDVRAQLETDPKLIDWGVDTTLIGSYKRGVAIYPCHDVDVFVKLPKCPETDPEVVFTEVERVLVARYGKRAKEQRRSMTVEGFAGDLSVDAVPAIPSGARWRIPQTDHDRKKNQWEETDPERMTDLSIARNDASQSVDGRHVYVPTVKLIRQSRRAHLGDAKPGGFYFELLTYWAFAVPVAGASFAEVFAETLRRVAGQLESGGVVINPAMNEPYDPPPSPEELTVAAAEFRRLATLAGEALACELCPAAVLWRQILGEIEGRGQCFPLPSGCTETGKQVPLILANRDQGPNRERGFA